MSDDLRKKRLKFFERLAGEKQSCGKQVVHNDEQAAGPSSQVHDRSGSSSDQVLDGAGSTTNQVLDGAGSPSDQVSGGRILVWGEAGPSSSRTPSSSSIKIPGTDIEIPTDLIQEALSNYLSRNILQGTIAGASGPSQQYSGQYNGPDRLLEPGIPVDKSESLGNVITLDSDSDLPNYSEFFGGKSSPERKKKCKTVVKKGRKSDKGD